MRVLLGGVCLGQLGGFAWGCSLDAPGDQRGSPTALPEGHQHLESPEMVGVVTRCPRIGPGCSHGSWPHRDVVGVGGRASSGARELCWHGPSTQGREGDFRKGVSKEAGPPKHLGHALT